jgi:prevent-host-death family protein
MKMKQDIKPVTYLKTNAAELIGKVQETRRPTVITQRGEAKAVIQDIESYERVREALMMLKLLVQGEQDISKGRTKSHSELMEQLERDLRGKQT